MCIHNNAKGPDAKVLQRYREPAWNNPVVRFVDARGQDLIPRQDRVWTTGPLVSRMIAALEAAKRPVPAYLRLVAEETGDVRLEKATFAMHCYWVGEARLGALDGVHTTRAGWLGGQEVVELSYDPTRIAYERLVETAQKLECASTVYTHGATQLATARRLVADRARPTPGVTRDAKPSDQKYQLRRTALRFLPLTPLQTTKANADLGADQDPTRRLSPRQRALLDQVKTLLAEKPDALADLEAPRDGSRLAVYEKALRERLGS